MQRVIKTNCTLCVGMRSMCQWRLKYNKMVKANCNREIKVLHLEPSWNRLPNTGWRPVKLDRLLQDGRSRSWFAIKYGTDSAPVRCPLSSSTIHNVVLITFTAAFLLPRIMVRKEPLQRRMPCSVDSARATVDPARRHRRAYLLPGQRQIRDETLQVPDGLLVRRQIQFLPQHLG